MKVVFARWTVEFHLSPLAQKLGFEHFEILAICIQSQQSINQFKCPLARSQNATLTQNTLDILQLDGSTQSTSLDIAKRQPPAKNKIAGEGGWTTFIFACVQHCLSCQRVGANLWFLNDISANSFPFARCSLLENQLLPEALRCR